MRHGILDELGSAVFKRLPGQEAAFAVFRERQADPAVLIYFQERGSCAVHAVLYARLIRVIGMKHCRVVKLISFNDIGGVITHSGRPQGHIQGRLVPGQLYILIDIVDIDVTAVLYRVFAVRHMDCADAGILVTAIVDDSLLPCLVNCRTDHTCIINRHILRIIGTPVRDSRFAVL